VYPAMHSQSVSNVLPPSEDVFPGKAVCGWGVGVSGLGFRVSG